MALGTLNSNLYAAGQQSQNVAPGTVKTVVGSFAIPANSSFATTDILKMCQFPGPASFFDTFVIDYPALDGGAGLTFSLVDTLASPTTFFTGNTTGQGAGWLSTTAATHGTMMSNTNGGLGYVGGIELRLVPTHASTSTSGASALAIYFRVDYHNL